MATHKEKYLWSEQLLILFLRRANFILMFLQEELTSLENVGKAFSSDLEGWKVKIFPSAGTMVTLLTLAN